MASLERGASGLAWPGLCVGNLQDSSWKTLPIEGPGVNVFTGMNN